MLAGDLPGVSERERCSAVWSWSKARDHGRGSIAAHGHVSCSATTPCRDWAYATPTDTPESLHRFQEQVDGALADSPAMPDALLDRIPEVNPHENS